ncbi:MAG TPA: DUF488 domain-containing protein [Candidatus Bathyarchaeia archaeon]|nr:DUF488 domain-containing protein [Candidatus Bathyarchaeia archaeon]
MEVLVDVRSIPFSKYAPQFNTTKLKEELENVGIKYVFMGNVLGGRPKDESCYKKGKIIYEEVMKKDWYKEGLSSLIELTKKKKVAIMCTEKDPYKCHRHNLIAQSLLREGVNVFHIFENGRKSMVEKLENKNVQSDSTIKLYTIGFTKKSAKKFFEILKKNNVEKIIDIRLNNTSQLAGFTKMEDFKYFLNEIGDIKYIHMLDCAPTEDLLKNYKKRNITWNEYEKRYFDILEKRNILKDIDYSIFNNACLLCSESSPKFCHRRLLAEYLAEHKTEISIIHL